LQAVCALLAGATLSGGTLLAAPAANAVTCHGASTAVAQTAGPYYKPGAPSRANITQRGTVGTPLIVAGKVLDSTCRPLAGARLEFWQADGRGRYDNAGYRLRGTQVTNATGAYRLTTVIPGQYPGRTEHIHVRITPRGESPFITQLYFPGSTHNEEDGIYSPAMLLKVVKDAPAQMRAAYTFVLP
jgi:protocatechuate 3,4-dioxygenase beta subunit